MDQITTEMILDFWNRYYSEDLDAIIEESEFDMSFLDKENLEKDDEKAELLQFLVYLVVNGKDVDEESLYELFAVDYKLDFDTVAFLMGT